MSRLRRGGSRRAHRHGNYGQVVIETALTFIIYATIIFAVIDLGRFIYYQNLVTRSADAAARELTIPSSQTQDCSAQMQTLQASNGVTITLDPNSVYGDPPITPPSSGGPSAPPPGQGYVYLYPAMARSSSNCNEPAGGNPRRAGTVSVQVTLSFQPWTPFIGNVLGTLKITSESSLQTEYSN